MPKGDKLTARQNRFVAEYLIDLNATQAAIRAGYSPQGVAVIASRNLTKANIQVAIAQALSDREKATNITPAWVLKTLKENAEAAMRENQRGVANRALELIGKHLQMFPDAPPITINQDNRSQAITFQVVYDPPPGEKVTLPTGPDAPFPQLNNGNRNNN